MAEPRLRVGGIGSPEGVALEDETGAEVLRVAGGAASGRVLDDGGATVNARSHGLVADGVADDTAAFVAAVGAARSANLPLDLTQGTVRLTNDYSIDLTGVPAIVGNAVIDCSASAADLKFRVDGTKTKIASEVALADGTVTVPVGSASGLRRGDVVILTSDEPLPSVVGFTPSPYYYYKGSRHIVQEVVGSDLTVYPPVPWDYEGAHVWKVDEARIRIGDGIEFRGKPGIAESCLRLRYADADIQAHFRHFGLYAVQYGCSSGSFTGTIKDVHFPGTTTSYGVSVTDLSEVRINATIYSGRHAVQGGGGGMFNRSESGGASGSAAYPASYNLAGGIYYTTGLENQCAVDAHGSMLNVVIGACTIYGGINIGAKYTNITGAQVFFKDSNGILVREDQRHPGWGYIDIADTTLTAMGGPADGATGVAIRVGGQTVVQRLSLNNVTIQGTFAGLGRPMYFTGDVKEFCVDGLTVRREGGDNDSQIILRGGHHTLRNLDTRGETITVMASGPGEHYLTVDGAVLLDGRTTGLRCALTGGATHWQRVDLHNVTVRGCWHAGVRVDGAKRLSLRGCSLNNNGVGEESPNFNRAGLAAVSVEHLTVENTDASSSEKQQRGIWRSVWDANNPDASTTVLHNVDLRGNVVNYSLPGTFLKRSGVINVAGSPAIPDIVEGVDGTRWQVSAAGEIEPFS